MTEKYNTLDEAILNAIVVYNGHELGPVWYVSLALDRGFNMLALSDAFDKLNSVAMHVATILKEFFDNITRIANTPEFRKVIEGCPK